MTPTSFVSAGEGINMPAKLRNLYQTQKLSVKVDLAGNRRTFTTLDKVEGTVSITASVDTSFDAIEIEFLGWSRTYVERHTTAAAVSGRSQAFHQFLKMQQPSLPRFYPADQVLKAGQVYTFPFVFVIPQQLLIRICRHPVAAETLRDAHLQLPPTFGDKDETRTSETLDDMVPDMASIRYGVFARVSKDKKDKEEATVRTTIACKAKKVRVIPEAQEQPPLDVGGDDEEYTMRREKTIRKGVLKGKLGTLVIEATQPPSVRLPARSDTESPPTSIATVMLRFDPIDDDAPPPRLGSLASKLKVCTFFASTARSVCPTKSSSITDLSQGLHTEQLNLASRCMNGIEWVRHEDGKVTSTAERRDSAQSVVSITSGVGATTTIPAPSAAYKNKSFYTARLPVPLALPSHKTFVPTFHSCLISRIYQLKLELGVQTAGIGGSVDLRLPLQISCDSPSTSGNSSSRHGSLDSIAEVDVDDEDIEDFFEPRMIRAPSDNFVGRSRLGSQAPVEEDDAPPGYSAFQTPGHARVPVH